MYGLLLNVNDPFQITDVLFNPMMMMMFLPLILITVLPKMMQVCIILSFDQALKL